MTSRDFGPAHPAFWCGQWRKGPLPNRLVEGYEYRHPYWSTNYFYSFKRPARWGSLDDYGGPFLWSRYGSPWNV